MLPLIGNTAKQTVTVSAFGGVDETGGCAADGLSAAENMCSDSAPFLAVRRKRAVYLGRAGNDETAEYTEAVMLTNADGITAAAFVDGKAVLLTATQIYYDGQPLENISLTGKKHGIVPFGRGFMVIPDNILVAVTENGTEAKTVDAPVMDLAVCRDNRIYGCRFGENKDGETVNEIYVCKQGDAESWSSFEGISTDSYAVSLGQPGAFTGAGVISGRTVFFKEDAVIVLSGDCPENYVLTAFPGDGVENGADRTVVSIRDCLYYKSRAGITAFDGAFPVVIRGGPGIKPYKNACAGETGGKYYIALTLGSERRIWVYDTLRGMWHTENCPGTEFFIRRGNCLMMVNCPAGTIANSMRLYSFAVTDARFAPGGVNLFSGESGKEYTFGSENQIDWYAVSGRIFSRRGKNLRLRRAVFALTPEESESISVYAHINDTGNPRLLKTVSSPCGGLMKIRCNLPACDFVRLKISGSGGCEIHALTLEYEECEKR